MSFSSSKQAAFGTFKGIFVPNVTMMFGVILFLRLGLVLGNVGLGLFLLIIALSLGVMILTSLSIAMIVTNMNVGSGGVYYLISRSIGIEIGGAIGIALVGAQLISMALCVSGFAYSLNTLYPQFPIAWIELGTMLFLALLSFTSTDLALKTQIGIFAILMVAISAVFFSQQPTNFSNTPYFNEPLKFWKAFALFYPALTGIEAGMALSGNLKNPSRALSKGNLASLVFAAAIYTTIAIYLWFHFQKESLQADPAILISSSRVPALIYIGIWSATLSSALGNFLGGPRILQTIAEDNIAPEIFSRSYGKHREPRYAVGFFFLIAIVLILTTTIDQILPILTMICLLTYGTLNLVAGLSALIGSPSFRPTFRVSPRYPLIAAALCLILMLMIDPGWALAAIFLISGLYIFIKRRSLDVTFDDIRESILLFFSRIALYRLSSRQQSTKNWLPQVLTVSRSTIQHEKMIRLADDMTGRSGILSIYTLLPQEQWEDPEQLSRTDGVIRDWLEQRKISGFAETLSYTDYHDTLTHLIKVTGIGPLQPNTVLLPVTILEDAKTLNQTISAGEETHRNILLFFHDFESTTDSKLDKPRKKRIDLWWDPQYKEGFELMLSLILALRTSPSWTFRKLTIRTIAPDQAARDHLADYLKNFLKKVRLKCQIEIEIGDISFIEGVETFSKDADLALFPMNPKQAFEDEASYQQYIDNLKFHFTRSPVPIVGVNGFDQLDHREIYLPE